MVKIRIDCPPGVVQVPGRGVGSSPGRFICVNDNTAPNVEFPLPRSIYVRRGRVGSGLEVHNYVNAPFALLPRILLLMSPESYSDNKCTEMDSESMVSRPRGYVSRASHPSSDFQSHVSSERSSRTIKKQEVGHIRLENIWSARLKCLGWSVRAAKQTVHSLADSTLPTYNDYIQKYLHFGGKMQVDFADT